MTLIFSILGAVIGLVSAACFFQIVLHAFRRSPGTGVLVLCIPFYHFLYAFRQFEHRHKNWILACWLGGIGMVVLLQLATAVPQLKLPPP